MSHAVCGFAAGVGQGIAEGHPAENGLAHKGDNHTEQARREVVGHKSNSTGGLAQVGSLDRVSVENLVDKTGSVEGR